MLSSVCIASPTAFRADLTLRQVVAVVNGARQNFGSQRPQDFRTKFEVPYKPLLDAGVKFYASLGNHDGREQRYYKLFNMDGQLYYSYKAPKQDVRFIALETTYLTPVQVKWLEEELKSSREDWKIVYFHHPLYSSGGTHGSDLKLRETLEPLFVKYGVSVVFSGPCRRRGSSTSSPGRAGSCARGTTGETSPFRRSSSTTRRCFSPRKSSKTKWCSTPSRALAGWWIPA